MNKFKKLDKIMPKHIIDNKIVEYFYSVRNSDDDAIIRVYYHELQCENNFSVDADVQIDIKPQVKTQKKVPKKKKLTKKQQEEKEYCKKMIELDEIRSLDGYDTPEA